jgi:uncharacterized cupin superfamily protein
MEGDTLIWKGKNAYISPVLLDEWEFVDGGESAGEVHWLRRSGPGEPLLSAGLWRHLPEEHPHGLPYKVEGSESIYVIDGMAELTLPDGSIMWLQEGYLASFGDGFEAIWKTKEPFMKFFVVTE